MNKRLDTKGTGPARAADGLIHDRKLAAWLSFTLGAALLVQGTFVPPERRDRGQGGARHRRLLFFPALLGPRDRPERLPARRPSQGPERQFRFREGDQR